ncbi:MAG: carbohydrate ABC transporter permease, partial [Thermotogota bacterium]
MKKSVKKTLKALALGLYLAFAIAPILWIFLTSIKPPEDIYTFPIKYWTEKPSFDAYRYLFGFAKFSKYFGNSVFVTMFASIVSTFFALFSGYALSRFRFKGKGFLLIFLFFTQMIPAYLLMIPQFQMFSGMKLTNNLFGIIIIYIGLGATFSTIMSKGFFDRIPVSMEEAGLIDGCTRLGVLFRITVPLLLPGLAAVFSVSFV